MTARAQLIWIRIMLAWSILVWGGCLGWLFHRGPEHAWGGLWGWWLGYAWTLSMVAMGGAAALRMEAAAYLRYAQERVKELTQEETHEP